MNFLLHAQVVTLKVGFSHDVRYTLPDALRAFLPEPTLIGLYGIDKNQVRIYACKSLHALGTWLPVLPDRP